jgi:pimeloyl-ACP methyl ester carboxylesterase
VARALINLIGISLILYAGMCALLYLSQRSMIYYPQPRSLGPTQSLSMLHTADAELVLTTHELAGPSALIYFGGNAEDVSLSLAELREAFPDKSLYLLHYRGYGGSSGKPSEAALHRDALAVYEMVRNKHARITLVGRSLGSGVAIRLAALRPAERLILVTPYYSLEDLAARQFPFVPVRWLLKDKYESWRHAPRIRTPAILIVAQHDEVIPAQSAQALHAAFPAGVAEYVVIRDAGHNDVSIKPEYMDALQDRAAQDRAASRH